jgi:hypothetical protein
MRRCLNPACAAELPAHMKRTARYCSDACGNRARRAARDGLADHAAPDRFWTGVRETRVRGGRRPAIRSRGATA